MAIVVEVVDRLRLLVVVGGDRFSDVPTENRLGQDLPPNEQEKKKTPPSSIFPTRYYKIDEGAVSRESFKTVADHQSPLSQTIT